MTISGFWALMDDSLSQVDSLDALSIQLGKLSSDDLIKCYRIFRSQMERACTEGLLVASLLIRGYLSDDDFEEFRAWLIGQGSDRFDAAVKDANSIAEWFSAVERQRVDGLDRILIYQEAYLKFGSAEEFYEKVYSTDAPMSRSRLPPTDELHESRIRRDYPRLYETFWNRELLLQSFPQDFFENRHRPGEH